MAPKSMESPSPPVKAKPQDEKPSASTSSALVTVPAAESADQVIPTPWNPESASPATRALADPFTTETSAKGRTEFHLKAEAAPFRPTVNGNTTIGISSLNANSLPDKPPTGKIGNPRLQQKVAHVKPIGTSVAPPDYGIVMMVGSAFTTDSDTDFDTSRYVAVHGLRSEWVDNGFLSGLLNGNAILESLISHKIVACQDDSVTVFCWFDDLRETAKCAEVFKSVHPSCQAVPIVSRAYFNQDTSNGAKSSVLKYDGQIELIVSFIGPPPENKLTARFDVAHQYAKAFGPLRSFAMHRTIGDDRASFRAEFYMLSTARGILKRAGTEHQIAKHYTAIIHDFKPDGYTRYSVPKQKPVKNPQVALAVRRVNTPISRPIYPAYQVTPGRGVSRGVRSNIMDAPGSNGGYDMAPIGASTPRMTRSAGLRHPQSIEYHGSDMTSPFTPRSNQMIPRTPSAHFSSYSSPRRSPWSAASSNLSPVGRKHDIQNQPQTVDVGKIESGLDVRTTLMIRNVPNRLNCEDFKDILDETSLGQYDFSYLRTDFGNNCNVGYAFVNFTRPEYILGFFTARVGLLWPRSYSDKVLEVSYATIQGQDCLIQKFRNSSVMQEYTGFRPKLWYTHDSLDIPADKKVGQEQEFPKPDNMSKLSRSLDNAQAIGLYPPRGARTSARRRHGQYDRGTPHALFEETMHGPGHRVTDENTISGVSTVRRQRMIPRFPGSVYNGSPLAQRSFNSQRPHYGPGDGPYY